MTHPNVRHANIEREQRRRQVSALMLAGINDSERIADQLGVSSRTIRRDIAELERRWQAEAAQDIATAKGKDLERIDRLIAALWPKAINGQWLATDRVLALMQHRAKLLGTEAPLKREDKVTIEVRTAAERIAKQTGTTVDEVIAHAERLMQESTV